MNKLKISLLSLLALLCTGTVMADEAEFSFDDGSTTYSFGTSKKENYDVAIRLDASFAGKKITAISVPLEDTDGITGVSVWLTKELTVAKKAIAPDIISKEGTPTAGYTTVTLDEPITIPAEGLYVGYTITVGSLTDFSKKPIQVNAAANTDGFYIHTSRTYLKFVDYSTYYNSTMRVSLSGVPTNAVTASVASEQHGQINIPNDIKLTLTNAGSTAVESIDYTYECNGTIGTGHANVAIGKQLGLSTTAIITLPALSTQGVYPTKITIDKVNGQANAAATTNMETVLNIYNKMPKHRAVMEEYTGTWCGYCPRGFVGLEVMNRLYPEDFIGLSYHNGDGMEIMSTSDFPSSISGFPAAWLDRYYETDAYYGDSNTGFGADEAWKTVCENFSLADIDVKGEMDDDNTKLTVTADVTFPLQATGTNYGVEFIVLGNGLTGEGELWKQKNYYAGGAEGSTAVFPEPEFEQFVNGASYVDGLHFNFVVIGTSRLRGTNATLPADIEEEKPYIVSADFEVSSFVNTSGESLIQDINKLQVVALLIDNTTGAIVNANKAAISGKNINGISTVENAKSNAPAEIFDLSGRRIQALQKGINIIRTADGRTTKVLQK